MRLLERIGVLLKADAHGVVESLEERSLLLKQCLRDIENELDENHTRLQVLQEQTKSYTDTRAREEETIAKLDDDIALAMNGDKEELARFAIRKLLTHRRSITAMTKQIEVRNEQIEALTKVIAEQQSKYRELKDRVQCEASQDRSTQILPSDLNASPIAEEEVELELMRRRQAGGAE